MNNPVAFAPHTHPADNHNVQAVQVRDTLITRASTSLDEPRQLVATVAQHTPVDVMLKLAKKESIGRAIRRRRRGTLPPEPSSRRVSFVWLKTDKWDVVS